MIRLEVLLLLLVVPLHAFRADIGQRYLDEGPKKQTELLRELDELVGLQTVKQQMHQLISQVKFNLERKALSLPDLGGQSLHMSFLGNPGTGKTVVARIVGELLVAMGAISSNRTGGGDFVVEASRADLVGQYVGQTAPQVKALVQQALGGVLFIDEAYAIVQGDRDVFGQEAVDTLMKEMEDRRGELIVIFAGYQTEMASFLAANAGLKSRVAFEFNFPDYTCSELVKIGELQMKGKNLGLDTSGPGRSFCDGGAGLESCSWLRAAIQLQTGCCDTSDCGKEENRANGNGRTVRNILEAAYRRMASRVLTTFPPSVLEGFDRTKKAKVVGVGKRAEPSPALDCGAAFQQVRIGGPYELKQLGGADIRCAFRVLEVADIKAALVEAVQEQLSANCMRDRLPVTVNATAVVAGPSSLDWTLLYEKLGRDRLCQEPQELLSTPASLMEISEHAPMRCDRVYCNHVSYCKNVMKCGSCEMCRKRDYQRPAGNKPGLPAGTTAANKRELKEMKCRLCAWAKKRFGTLTKKELIEVALKEEKCRHYLSNYGFPEYMQRECETTLRNIFVQMSIHYGRDFACNMAATGEICSASPAPPTAPIYGSPDPRDPKRPAPVFVPSKPNPLHVPSIGIPGGAVSYKPVERPGSKVQELMAELDALIGLESVKLGMSTLRDAVEFDLWRKRFLGDAWSLLGQSFHMKFLGNPGTGKTVVARIIGKILVELKVVQAKGKSDFIFKEVTRNDLVAGYTGQTAPKVQEAVKSAFGGVLFIDEAYSLVQGERDSFGREAVDTLIKEIEDHRDKLIVIFAGYHDEMESFFEANPGFESRVPFRFDFADYNCQQLGEIANLQLKEQETVLIPTAKPWLETVIAAKTGCCTSQAVAEGTCAGSTRDNGNGRSVRNILESTLRSMSVRAVASGQATYSMMTQVVESDVVAVAGEMLADSLRNSCKAESLELPDLEDIATGSRVLSATTVSGFADLLSLSQEDCAAATQKLQAARPQGRVYNALNVPLSGARIQAVFKELDEYIGLQSVKRAMRELYCTTQFAQMRKKANVKPLKGQSYHMRFLGNPGTGKTVVARVVGRLLVELGVISKSGSAFGKMFAAGQEPIFNEVSRSDLVAEYLGQTANKTQHAVSKSLGGVLFLDEAYSLVQGDRDSFGKEAVDTLIKEMEDKRQQLVVICAGYEQEMDTFFESNPGFKSRVPFTFHFEDYTCPQLSQMGHLMMKKKSLQLPADVQAFNQAVRFHTGCCDKLEECEESRDRGNGRAVRNAMEASLRFMASRVSGSGKTPTKEMYSQMEAADFEEVTRQAIEARLAVPCGPHGELQKLAVGKALPGKQEDLLRRLQRLVTDTALVASMKNLDTSSQALGETCSRRIQGVYSQVIKNLKQTCSAKGRLDELLARVALATQGAEGEGRSEIQMLKAGMADTDFSSELLDTLGPAAEDRQAVQELCAKKVQSVKASKVVPFDFFTQR